MVIFMGTWFEKGYSNNSIRTQLSPGEAVRKLRWKIRWQRFRHLSDAAWIAWLASRILVKAAVLLLLEVLILGVIPGGMVLETYAFMTGNVLLLVTAFMELKKKYGSFWKRRWNRGFVIGRSFRHFTGAGPGSGPMEVGTDSVHRIDYDGEPNHHILINGSTSSGKTATMLAIAARASLCSGINFLMIDWNGENMEWAESVGAVVWKVPENFRINLFRLKGMGKEARASMAVESLMVAARLTPLQSTRVRSALLRLYNDGMEPSLYDLWSMLCSGKNGNAGVLDQRLRAIQRVIGYEPEEFWKGVFARNNLISLSGLNESEKSLVVYSLMQRISELFDRSPELNSRLRLIVVIDEAWQFIKREREFDIDRESSLEKVVRLGRKYGFGLVVSTQQIEDVPKVFINSCALLMLHQQREHRYFGREVLGFGEFEDAYLTAAGQGEMLLFDRGVAQKGQLWPDYIKVDPLSGTEASALSALFGKYVPYAIHEPEMPIEMHDSMHASGAHRTGSERIFSGLDIPSVAVYRFMIAIERTGSITEAYSMLREKGWLTSLASLYGGKRKPSILSRAISSGYVSQEGRLTEKGLSAVNPERIIAKQGIYSGSEEHKELMRRTIKRIQDRGNFAFTLSDKNSFDVGELKAKMRRIWDYEDVEVYECQTNALQEELNKCVERSRSLNVRMSFVANNREIAKAIEESTGLPCTVLL